MEKRIEIKEVSPDMLPRELLLEADPSIEHVNQYLDDSFCYIALYRETIVGLCVLKPLGRQKVELFNIAVLPENQKSGIGSLLLQFVLDALRLKGIESVELGTGTFGYQLAFYQRFGFRVDSILKDHFTSTYDEPPFCIHGLNGVFLERYGWYRVDPRGNKPGVDAQFCPPKEQLAFPIITRGEADLQGIWPDPLPIVIEVLENHQTYDGVAANLPDIEIFPSDPAQPSCL